MDISNMKYWADMSDEERDHFLDMNRVRDDQGVQRG